jgi:hypothetical protein
MPSNLPISAASCASMLETSIVLLSQTGSQERLGKDAPRQMPMYRSSMLSVFLPAGALVIGHFPHLKVGPAGGRHPPCSTAGTASRQPRRTPLRPAPHCTSRKTRVGVHRQTAPSAFRRLLSRPIAMLSRLDLHHTDVHRVSTSPVCQRTAKPRPVWKLYFRSFDQWHGMADT